MGNDKNSQDGAHELAKLSPFELFPYAAYFPEFDIPGSYKRAYRRYRTLPHAKSAIGNRPGAKFFAFNFDIDEWKEIEV